MQFSKAKTSLLELLNTEHVKNDIKNQDFHRRSIDVFNCSDGAIISISYPGVKSKIESPRKIRFDYKVTLQTANYTTALSHSNIILDIYNKIYHGNMNPNSFWEVLLESMLDRKFYFHRWVSKLGYNPIRPSSQLITAAKESHGNKKFNENGNRIDLPLEVLFQSIKWIALQEDINYPIEENFEGRRLSLYRYFEAIQVASKTTDHSIEEVLQRSILHTVPSLWPNIDYLAIKTILS